MNTDYSLYTTRRSAFLSIGLGMVLALLIAAFPAAATTIVVNGTADTTIPGDGVCTLREAIANANADQDTTGGDCAPGFGADVISFAPVVAGQTITLTGTPLVISSTITINGLGASQLAVSAGNASRVFDIVGGGGEISGMTIRDGYITDANGGGIRNTGTLILRDSTVVSNTIASGGTTEGGGIYNTGILTLTHSAVVSNTAMGSNGRGGGVASASGRVSIANSTISGNTANYWGGGVLNAGSSAMDVVNSTVVENTAINFWGGGLYVESTTNLKNSILANNTDSSGARDCYYIGSAPTSQGYNLVKNVGNCTFGSTGDLTGQDPDLGPLADNTDPVTDPGQATWTHAPLPGSPAIEHIPEGVNGCGAAIATDQRGYLRVGACDVGALETQGIKVTLSKSVDDDTPEPGQTITYTLVVAVAQSGGVSITHTLISDTLPDGLNFLGPVTLVGGGSAVIDAPPRLVSGLTITGGTVVTVTFPVTVSLEQAGGAVLTNTAAVSSAEVLAPVTGWRALTVTNVAPLAVDDTAIVLEDSGTTALDVLANDDDRNGDSLAIAAVGPTDHGGLAIENGARIDYTPVENFVGTEVFTYTVSDGSLSDTATVSVTVSPANDAPVISQGEAVIVTMSEDGDPIAFNLTLSAEDVDGDILEWQIDQDAGHGTATISHTTGVSAAISYTPDTDYYGPDDFDVRVSDGELSDTVTVSVTIEPVNEAPRAIDDYGVLLWGSGENAFTLDVLSNDVEPDGETPYISDVGTPSNGNVTIANLQSLVYTPSITGTDSFTYTISDGSLEDTATVNVAIADGNESGGSGETLLVPNTGGNNSITVTIEIPPDVGSGHEHFALIYGETTDPHDPPQGYAIAGLAFSLNAYVDSVHTAPFTFSTPITLTILYADTDLADIGQGEQALELRYWDGSEWRSDSQGITVVSRDTEQNLLVITIGHLTEFALIGEAGSEIYLPLVVRGMP